MVAIIVEQIDSIFHAPEHSVLIHACNCRGVWGTGVAKDFKQQFPEAFEAYKSRCKNEPAATLLGTAFLIPTSSRYVVACLFTSLDYGKNVDPIDSILRRTRQSVQDLARQIREIRTASSTQISCVWSVRINSGRFGVPWLKTLEVLQDCDLDMTVVRREEDDADQEEGEIVSKTSVKSSKSAATSKVSETKANESKKLSEPKPSEPEPPKSVRKPIKKKADKPKAKAPPKGIPKTDRVLRIHKPKPKVIEVNDDPVPAKPKKAVKKPTKTPTKAATKVEKPAKKKAAAKPKAKKVVADAVAPVSPSTASDQSASREQRLQKRKRNEVAPSPSKRAKK